MPECLALRASERLVARAVAEGMAGFVYQRLKKIGQLGMLSEPARRRLEAVYYLTLQTNLKRLSILHDILAPELPVVLIQGAALLVELYDDPGLRPLTDIDLWVPSEDKEHLLAALSRLGFRANPSTPGLLRRADLLIDVHTHLLGAERIRSRSFLLSRSQKEIFQACRRRCWEGREMLCLDERADPARRGADRRDAGLQAHRCAAGAGLRAARGASRDRPPREAPDPGGRDDPRGVLE